MSNQSTESRFWSKVSQPSDEECWPWLCSTNEKGYGQFWLNRKYTIAHRLAWCLTNDVDYFTLPKIIFICHDCDNPGCCNPDHLFVGDSRTNQIDAFMKKRRRFQQQTNLDGSELFIAHGENNGMALLTDDKVREIRRLNGSMSGAAIARRFGVSPGCVYGVLNGSRWAHVDGGES